jgi:hypothetical protein
MGALLCCCKKKTHVQLNEDAKSVELDHVAMRCALLPLLLTLLLAGQNRTWPSVRARAH